MYYVKGNIFKICHCTKKRGITQVKFVGYKKFAAQSEIKLAYSTENMNKQSKITVAPGKLKVN